MALNFTYRHAACVERENFVVKASPAGLVFADELWLEGTGTVPGNFNGQFAEVALEGFLTATIAGVAGVIGDQLVFAMTKVLGHFRLQCALYQRFGELL